jgi:hypothetical protein
MIAIVCIGLESSVPLSSPRLAVLMGCMSDSASAGCIVSLARSRHLHQRFEVLIAVPPHSSSSRSSSPSSSFTSSALFLFFPPHGIFAPWPLPVTPPAPVPAPAPAPFFGLALPRFPSFPTSCATIPPAPGTASSSFRSSCCSFLLIRSPPLFETGLSSGREYIAGREARALEMIPRRTCSWSRRSVSARGTSERSRVREARPGA